jgi:hypothetical protein
MKIHACHGQNSQFGEKKPRHERMVERTLVVIKVLA